MGSFNEDVRENGGYLYTTNASFSSKVANKRISEETRKYISPEIHTIIDAGCGDGIYTNEIAFITPGTKLTGFDPAVDAIQRAGCLYPDIVFVVGDVLRPETFPKKKYDMAIMRGVIHHLPIQKDAIANMPLLSTKLFIIEPNGNNPILKIIEKVSSYHIEHEEQSFSTKSLVSWCMDAGYNQINVTYIGFVPFFCWEPLAKFVYFFQPFLEKIPLFPKYFGAQIAIYCEI
ncbi:MAG: Methyltransferase type 12 [Candidatus Peribacteria bacterium]|nr:Methyltransferase type 12 [Candidatus Peribacteria bacterium]